MTTFKERVYSFKEQPYRIACVETSPYHASWFSHEDESTVRDAQWGVEQGDLVIDVGAAYGSYCLTSFAVGAARAYAWSPQGEAGLPLEAEFFQESLRLNGWEERCTIYRSGLYNKDGWLNTMTQEFSTEPPVQPDGDIIQVSRLDTWYEKNFLPNEQERLSSYPKIWLKIDVEGAEIEVLNGAIGLLNGLRPNIQVENHNFKRATLEQEVRDFLTSIDYREVVTSPHHSVSHSLYVPKDLTSL